MSPPRRAQPTRRITVGTGVETLSESGPVQARIRRSDTLSHSEVVILLRSRTMESNEKHSPPLGGTSLSYLEDIGPFLASVTRQGNVATNVDPQIAYANSI